MDADQHIDWEAAAAATLDWWREAGVDILVDEAPRDWLAVPPVVAARREATVEPAGALPDTLSALAEWRVGPAAPEAAWPGRRLAGTDREAAALALVTDWPERSDFAAGVYFAEAQGRLLDHMLRAIGLTRDHVAIVPVATARPPSARAADSAMTRLGEVTRHHLALLRPTRVLLLGDAASRALLGTDCRAARGSLHGIHHKSGQARVIASFHPRLLLDRPMVKAEAWRDLMVLGDA